MYDPTIGQFLSEDPIEFEGLDENLRRYVRNRVLDRTDPTGLSPLEDVYALLQGDFDQPVPPTNSAAQSGGQNVRPQLPLILSVNFIDLTSADNPVKFSETILEGANTVLSQAGVVLQYNEMIALPLTGAGTDQVIFNGNTHTFVGGPYDGKTLAQVLAAASARPSILYVILVDEIKHGTNITFGLSYEPGNPNGTAIILPANMPPKQSDKSPQNTFAHECGNFFGLPDFDRDGVDSENLMSYGRWTGMVPDLIRGTLLLKSQIDRMRAGVSGWR